MRRDPSRLTASEFDLLVVGAGIYGATVAWEATQRGLRVALVDKGDFGSGTSFHNARTVHGGVRSLQRGHVGELREYLRERRTLLRVLPHLVHPLPFVMPTGRGLTRNRLALAAYFLVYDALTRDRNDIPDPSRHLPPSRTLSREECLRLTPMLDPDGVTGGIEWHDAQFSSSSRAELAFIRSAVDLGLEAANYVEAQSPLLHNGAVGGVMARSVLDGLTFPIRAKRVLLATGGWTDAWIAQAAGARPAARTHTWSVAMNLVLRRRFGTHAVAGTARGRLFFLSPWRGATIGGTSHDPFHGGLDPLVPRQALVQQLLDDLRAAFPRATLSADDITFVHRGLLPATRATEAGVTLLRSSPLVDHASDGCRGLFSLVGVRYTTARASAEHAVDAIAESLGVAIRPSASATTPLHGGAIDHFAGFLADARRQEQPGLSADTIERLVTTYGTAWADVLRVDGVVAPSATLSPTCAVTRAEVAHAVREEMAVTLADALLRRTEAGTRGLPDDVALRTAADVMGDELGWSAERRLREQQDVRRLYDTPLTA